MENVSVSRGTILLVEDEYSNYYFMQILLRNLNFEVILALNGQEAIDAVKANQSIALVFMDLKMPVLNGFEATRQIKILRPDLPVIAQTAYTINTDKYAAIDAGCIGYITKPVKKSEIIAFVDKYFPQ